MGGSRRRPPSSSARRLLLIGDGYRAKNSEFVDDGGLPFIRVGDITNRIRTDVRDELPLSRVEHYEPKVSQTNDSLITMKGTVGRVARVSSTTRRFVYSPQISFWRVRDPLRLDPRFVSYWLRSPAFAEQAIATKSGTDMADYINLRDQRRMSLLLPPLATQQRVATVLSAFDELIEINQRRIELLEDLARSLYREWFVRFRFPGHEDATFVDSALGAIPDGWQVRRLRDFVSTQYGFTASADDKPVGPRFLRGMDINKRSFVDWSVVPYCKMDEELEAKFKLEVGDVCVIRMANPGRVGIVERPIDAVFASYLVRLRSSEPRVPQYLLFHHLDASEYQSWISGSSTGSTRKSASAGVLTEPQVVVPSQEFAALFDSRIGALRGELTTRVEQSAALAATRDLLLPRLVTGRLDISEIDLSGLLPPEAA